jgi:hypothetical protein
MISGNWQIMRLLKTLHYFKKLAIAISKSGLLQFQKKFLKIPSWGKLIFL